MNMQLAKLTAAVDAQNAANQIANDLFPKMREAFRPFVGKKILKADGSLTQAVQNAIARIFPDNKVARVFRSQGRYHLGFRVSVSRNYSEHSCLYKEAGVVVGMMDGGGILDKIYEENLSLRTDFRVEEIQAARELVRVKRNELSRAEGELMGFGEHDN
ncbi:MAG: hypothetical protein EKK57_07255 [Proteobacteria bacterium]|nr:MAG: hypothetical protein EKK57_07255 [Pseudomonadota bacterium]